MSESFIDLSHGFAGSFLIASPFITTPAFAQTVIFICAHSLKEGTMGIVINRHIAQPTPAELLKQLGIDAIPDTLKFSISAGGPIENAHGLVLHTNDWESEESISITETIQLSTSLDILRDLSKEQGPSKSLLALGHASWEPGQLEEELQNNIWYIAPCQEDILFSKNFRNKWRNSFDALSINPGKLSYFHGQA